MVYQLQRPSIEMIIDYCRDLLADEKLEVYEFGQNCDLVLHIYKDGEYSPSADKDIFKLSYSFVEYNHLPPNFVYLHKNLI